MAVTPARVWLIVALTVFGLGLILSLLLVYLLLTGAGAEARPDQSPNPALTPAATVDPTVSTAQRIRHRGALRIGVRSDLPPFGFRTASGELVGFDIDLAREFARRWLNDAEALELAPLSAAERIPRLLSGEVDLLIAALEHRRERDAFIDFSQSYYLDGYTLLTRADGDLNDLAALAGRTVAVLQDPAATELVNSLAAERGVQFTLNLYQAYQPAVAALTAGDVDAVVGQSTLLQPWAQTDPALHLSDLRLTAEPFAIGTPQGDSALRELVNSTLQTIKADGTYDAIFRHWFPAESPFALEITPGETALTLQNLPGTASEPPRTRIQMVLERGQLVAGVRVDLSPFGVREEGGRLSGFDIDLVREFARRWLGDENAVAWVTGPAEEQLAHLAAGEVDLAAAALPRQREWTASIDFSQTYLTQPPAATPYAIGLPYNDAMFRELVNVTLQAMKADGSYDRLYARWFGQDQLAFALALVPGDADYLLLPKVGVGLAPLSFAPTGEPTIARIHSRNGQLVAGFVSDAAPFSLVDPTGAPTGFDVDLVRLLAEQWGVTVAFVPVGQADRLDRLLAGEIDVIAGALGHSKEREALIDFSQSYAVSGQRLLALRDRGVTGLTTLAGATVGVLVNAPQLDQIQATAEAGGLAITFQPYGDYASAVAALKAGQVAALVGDNAALAQLTQSDPELALAGDFLTAEPLALGLFPGDAYFRHLVDSTLQELKISGRYDTLYQRWFGAQSTPFGLELLPGVWPYRFADSPVQFAAARPSRVDPLLARGRIVAGVGQDQPPFSFLDANGQPAGFEVDLVRALAQRWLGDDQAVDFVPLPADRRLPALLDGEVDLLAAALVHTRPAAETVEFSQTYWRDSLGLLVRQEGGVAALADLEGRSVAALHDATFLSLLAKVAAEAGMTVTLSATLAAMPAVDALRTGQVDALVGPLFSLNSLAQQNPDLALLSEPWASVPYAIGLPSRDDRLRDLVNFTLQEMKLDGSYDRLTAQWFGADARMTLEHWSGRSYLPVNLTPMRRIPAGEFVRGNNAGFPDEQPEQRLDLAEFYIDQFEVTNRLYAQCVAAGECSLPRLPRSVNFSAYYAESLFGNYPVIWVSWQDAANYCQFVGKRLPTEAEWEKAARGDAALVYPWGNDEPTTQTNFNYLGRDVAPVGAYPSDVSPYGVHDLAGNVREWVADWYQWDYFGAAPSQNPGGPASGVTRVFRGGGWNDVAVYLRTTVRKNYLPESFDSNLGFRCASSVLPLQ